MDANQEVQTDVVADQEFATLRQGRNCWRIERADRFGLIIDGADYFRAVKDATLKARHCVYLVGWDFDTRIAFEPEGATLEGPNQLGRFLRWIDRQRPDLDVYVLKWDLGTLQTLGRGMMPLTVLDWTTSKRVHLKLDGAHPSAAAHHQKVVVVDDVLAFCGGIDVTSGRWDTRDHNAHDKRRKSPSGKISGPWHDASTAVDGALAGALGDLARARWKSASGEALDPPPATEPIWPEGIAATLTNVDVAIARTMPEYGDRPQISEIETFYLDAIAAARHTLYCESQYFASRRIAEAIAKRLAEPDGPEIVVINPETADGFLEPMAMDTARYRLLDLVGKADTRGRFAIYTPVNAQGEAIYVHAKITIADDRLLRVGSSNFNNRSMGFDTECDLIVEADGQSDADTVRATIAQVRADLLAEHLGMTPRAVMDETERTGSLIAAIEALRGQGHTLVPYTPDEPAAFEEVLAENDLLDPERPPSWGQRFKRFFTHQRSSFS